eukprot:scaffold4958_cov145-Skeletonema_marinoi.AAC.5
MISRSIGGPFGLTNGAIRVRSTRLTVLLARSREMALEMVGGNFWKESSRQKPTAFRAQSRKTTGKTIDPFTGHGWSFCPVRAWRVQVPIFSVPSEGF